MSRFLPVTRTGLVTAALCALLPISSVRAESFGDIELESGPVETIMSFPVPDPAWDDVPSPRLVGDRPGNITAFWYQEHPKLYTSSRTDAGTWSEPEVFPACADGCSGWDVAVDTEGTLFFVALKRVEDRLEPLVATKPLGKPWRPAVEIAPGDRSAMSRPMTVRVAANGAVLITFRSAKGPLVAAYRRPAIGWARLDRTEFRRAGAPRVALSDSGRAVVVTSVRVRTTDALVARVYHPRHGWRAPHALGRTLNSQYAVAMAPDGRAVVGWVQYRSPSPGIVTRQYVRAAVLTVRDGWRPPIALTPLAPREGLEPGRPRAASTDRLALSWSTWNGRLHLAEKRGSEWERSMLHADGNLVLRGLKSNPNGDLAVLYETYNQELPSSFVALRPRGGEWSAPHKIYTDESPWEYPNARTSMIFLAGGGLIVGYGADVQEQIAARTLAMP